MTAIPFTKMVGAGNDFVVMDTVRHPQPSLASPWRAISQAVCDRHTGIGADGLLVLERSRDADVRMRVFNPDGSEAEMCGNGIRCLAWYAYKTKAADRVMTVETRAGIKRVAIQEDRSVSVNMGVPRQVGYATSQVLRAREVEIAHIMDAGVPHLVCWVKRVDDIDVQRLGRRLRHHALLRPKGANIDFVEVINVKRDEDRVGRLRRERVTLKMRTYERGVEGETRACGTGAVAASASYAIPGPYCVTNNPYGGHSDPREYEVDVRVPGGLLHVTFPAEHFFGRRGLVFGPAFLEGEARILSTGVFTLNERGSA